MQLSATARIGIVGVGRMGHGVARNILRGGFPLCLLDHPGNQPVADLLEAGATTATSASRLASEVDVLLLCVTGSPQVEDVVFRADGVLAGLRPGTVVIDMSTAEPASTLRTAAAVLQAGGAFLDAPMTRTPKEAEAGRIGLLVGGDATLLESVRPLLASFAEHIVHAGPLAAGHRMKLLHNFVSLGFCAVLAEATACAQRAGVDTAAFVDVLRKGGGAGVALERLAPYFLEGDTSAFSFSIANALKDTGYYAAMAREVGALHDTADAVRATYARTDRDAAFGTTVPQLVDVLRA